MKGTLWIVSVTAIVLVTLVAWAEESTQTSPPSPKSSAEMQESESQQLAQERVMEMAKFLAATKQFSCSLQIGYDVVQNNGQKIEFGENRDILVQRPNHVRIDQKEGTDNTDLMMFDGTKISIFNGASNVYAQAPQPGDIDTTVVYFVRDLQMRLPLAPLLMNQLPKEFERRIKSIELVERTEMLGKPALHVAGQTTTVDFQIWIAEGEQPLPLRIILSYPEVEGYPQFWANFSKWNLSPEIGRKAFTFAPPADATQIMFAAQFQVSVGDSPNDQTLNKGGK